MTRRRPWASALLVGLCGLGACHHRPSRALRVCADPNNLPYSNRQQGGFENQLASLVAADRGAALEYTWSAQRRGFLRNTLDAGRCDVVMGLPAASTGVRTTRPYYRSSYVFVARRDSGIEVTSLDDPRLRRLTVAIQMIGDDATNSPPAHALSRRGIVSNVVGYSVFGDYSSPAPLLSIVDAVARRDVDVAIVWGPTAGFFARNREVPLALHPLAPTDESPTLPLTFAISMAVRRGDAALGTELDDVIRRRRADIDRILAAYSVPIVRDPRDAATTP